jgi:two-component system, LytTR family, sensor kinase
VTRRGFWTAQLLWWGFYVVVFHVASIPGLTDPSLHGHLVHLGQKLLKAGAGFAASLALYALYARGALRLRLPVLGACAFAVSFVLGVAWELAARAMYLQPIFDDQLWRASLLPTFVLTAWSALYFSFVYRDRANAESERALRATALATAAELAMLRYQVNPHFLFNSLNSLRALIDENPAAARTMVTQLAELFRHSLRTTRDELTVDDELTAVRHYLDIQKIRFDDGLETDVRCDGDAARTALAGFLIHPLVENAVKYGLETSDRPLRVAVAVARRGDQLEVEVRNTGRWLDDGARHGAGTGTGLRNLRARLAHLYPDRHALDVGEHDGEVRARLMLQLAPTPPAAKADAP